MSNIYHWNRGNTNCLLTKDDIGKSKPSTYKLPQNQFAYGRPNDQDAEGAKEGIKSKLKRLVSMSWQYHLHSREIVPERDFTKLNKMCIKDNLYKSNQFTQYRKSNDARIPVRKGQAGVILNLPEENFRYGQPNR